ncbi:NAD(P)H-binding protein [Vibrio paucivorans]|uniref:NAD(P)H-binding protein n=1 Tax=Vibrio paucivorans TaxID=2829489 RepID=A0A9X3CIU7_9VIBR|nr:NAD(P)H-binding protein [Vibrio paucivorans]MCW8336269.1 NAD(P)H-binding protein [Vibrio paucivorans]
MSIIGDNSTVIIAGGSGLVGSELTKLLLENDPISKVYALVRQPLPFFHPKLEAIQDDQLRVLEWNEEQPIPEIGFICLGTTKKKAGSKAALEKIDYELVCDVAQSMKVLGVKKVVVVSSYGASVQSLSHYLKCKGKMEHAISRLGFENTVFVRPGPLRGIRDEPRNDELVLQVIMKAIRPLMIGKLRNLIPIDATDVATAMLYSAFDHSLGKHSILTTVQMRELLEKYLPSNH